MKISPAHAVFLPNHIIQNSLELYIHDKMDKHYKVFAEFLFFFDIRDLHTLISATKASPYPLPSL